MKTAITTFACAALLAGAASAQTKTERMLYDLNGDGSISDQEWAQARAGEGTDDSLRAYGDGTMSREEYDRQEFQRADTNRDGRIDSNEYGLYNGG